MPEEEVQVQLAPVAEGGGDRPRAGGYVLYLFARSLVPGILRALAERPLRLGDLREGLGWPAQTTLRTRLVCLVEIGAVAKRARGGMPHAVEHEPTALGRELLFVADVLEAWLARSPHGPVELESETARTRVKALAGGWQSAIVRALAGGPLTLTQLDDRISGVNYPNLERRLDSMRATGLVEPAPGAGRGTPYALTEWMRRGIAPVLAAIRCERRHLAEQTSPATCIDVEAAFLLAIPLLEQPPASGAPCQLAVHFDSDGLPPAGVEVSVEGGVEGGGAASCIPRLGPEPPSWALGSAPGWLDAVIGGSSESLKIGGRDPALARALVDGLHEALFGA